MVFVVSTIKRIAKNTGVFFVAQIVSYVFMFVYVAYTARYLGADGFGILSLALAITGIFGILAELGLTQLTVREVARNKKLTNKYLGNVALIRIILAIFTFLLAVLVVKILNYPQETAIVIYFITLYVILSSFSKLFYSIFQAYEHLEYQSAGTILNSLLILVITLVAMQMNLNIVIFALIYFIVSLIILIINILICVFKFTVPKLEIDLDFWKITLTEALFFGLAGIFTEIYFNIDSVMLSVIVGNTAVGWYYAAYRIIFILMFIPTAVIVSVFPLMSKYFESAKDLLKKEFGRLFRYLFTISIFLLVYGILFADKIILIIFGNDYTASILSLEVLMCVIPIIFLTYLFGNLLAAINKQRLVTLVTALCALFNIIINLYLIPRYSYIGASVATVLTEGVVFVMMFTYISKYFYKISVVNSVVKPLISGAVTAFCIYYLIGINWIIAAFLGVIIFILILKLIKGITDEDISIFKSLFQDKLN